jgi:hypothetical protein
LFLFKLVPNLEQVATVAKEIIEPFRREEARTTAAA